MDLLTSTNISAPSNGSTPTAEDHFGDHEEFIKPWFKSVLYVVFITTCVTGTVSNISIIFIIIKRRNVKRVIHFLTLNLAVSDMLVLLIYLPSQLYLISMHMKWNLGPVPCRFFYIVNAFTVNASICTLVAITRDRYLAVCKPMATQSRGVSAIKLWLPVIWICSFAATLPLLFVVDIDVGYCTESGWPSALAYQSYWIVLFCMQIVIPLIFFTIAYSIIIYQFSNRKPNLLISGRTEHSRRAARRSKQKRKLLKMSVMLIVVYAVCSSPQHVVFLVHTFGDMTHGEDAFYAFSTANFLMILNSALNPIIYGSQTNEMKTYISKTLPWVKTMRKAVSSMVGRKRPTTSFVGYYTIVIQMSLLNMNFKQKTSSTSTVVSK